LAGQALKGIVVLSVRINGVRVFGDAPGIAHEARLAGGAEAVAIRGADEGFSTAEAAADAALASGKLSGAASELRVGGRVFTGVSGEVVPHNPQVTGLLMSTPSGARPDWHGGCSEVVCIDKALNAGVDPRGGVMRTVNIGISGAGHNTPKKACGTCDDMMDFLGISHD
jgi:hypothetical protein